MITVMLLIAATGGVRDTETGRAVMRDGGNRGGRNRNGTVYNTVLKFSYSSLCQILVLRRSQCFGLWHN